MDKVIVVGCGVTGYSVIRALANKNIHIIAITDHENDVAHLSRHVLEVVHIPRPDEDNEQFVALLTRNTHRWEGALILEASDSKAVTLSKNKEALSKYYRIATPDWEILKIFIQKEKTYALAKECNVPFPGSILLSGPDDLSGISDIRYPCILKPVRSFEFASKFHVKNFTVNNNNELSEKFKLCIDAGQSMILQEIIPGPDENLFKLQGYINSQGKMVGRLFNRKLRQHPAHFGVMRVGVSTDAFPEVEQYTERLLRRASYKGYFSIEFKKDPRDGQLKLIENNCRMPRSSMVATASGVNHPWIIYQDLVKNHQIDVTDYKVETYMIELLKDFPDSIFRHKEENIRLYDYFKPYLAKNKVFSDVDVLDLKPFMKLTSEIIGKAFRRPFHKASRR